MVMLRKLQTLLLFSLWLASAFAWAEPPSSAKQESPIAQEQAAPSSGEQTPATITPSLKADDDDNDNDQEEELASEEDEETLPNPVTRRRSLVCPKVSPTVHNMITAAYPLGYAQAHGIEVYDMKVRLVVQTLRWKEPVFARDVLVEWGIGSSYQVLVSPKQICRIAKDPSVMRIRKPGKLMLEASREFRQKRGQDVTPKKRIVKGRKTFQPIGTTR